MSVAGLALPGAHLALADDTWTSTTGGNWTTGSDWSSLAAPTAGQNVDINSSFAGTQTITFNSTLGLTYGQLTVDATGGGTNILSMSANNLTASTEIIGDSGGGGNGTFTQYGGADTTTANGNFTLGNNSTDTGVYNMNGGTLSIGGRYYVGYNGTGTVNQMNGNISVAANFVLFVGNSSTATGIYNLSGGTLTTTGDANGGDGDELIGVSGNATFYQTGGINTVGGQASMWVAANPGKTAVYNLSGGTLSTPTLNLSTSTGTGTGTLNISGTGVANIGGSITGYNNSALVLSGGLLNIEDNGIASAANPITTVDLPAPGQTAGIQSLGGAGINGAGLDMNDGGTLLLIGTSNSYSGGTTIAAGSVIQVGGTGGIYSPVGSIPSAGNIDDEGALVFGQSNNISLSGAITGAGSVFIAGSGTTTLSGNNTYSSGTSVNGGTLVIAPTTFPLTVALPDGPVTIGAAGTLQLADNADNSSPPPPILSPLYIQLLKITSLSIATGGVLDIRNNHFNVADPGGILDNAIFTNLYGYIKTGAITSTEPGYPGNGYGIGLVDGNDSTSGTPVSSGQIEVAYTLEGDANLDGKVDATDFGIFAPNFGLSTTLGWEAGDFNYDGKVDATDFGLFAPNFGLSDSGVDLSLPAADYAALDAFAAVNGLSLTSVPEPASMGLFVMGTLGVLFHRRRAPKR